MLKVAGTSEIWETRYAGVWWVRHFGAGDKIAAERIEIAAIPQIFVPHRRRHRGRGARAIDPRASGSETARKIEHG